MLRRIVTTALLVGFYLIWPGRASAGEIVPLSVTETQPHDARSYTQGLFFIGDYLYESSGLYGRSAFSRRRFPAGAVDASYSLPEEWFAEGSALAEGEIYLLTWKENTAVVLDPESLAVKRFLGYEGEGWGLTFDGERLWRSDGSNKLYPHKPGDFSPDGPPVRVFFGRRSVGGLNELEWDPVHKVILANVYGLDYVAVIDPSEGCVLHWLDGRPLRVLAEKAGLETDAQTLNTVLNGLALAPDGRSLWLTGKLWPEMYQVEWPPSELTSK
ncbi:glutaminyl-peptide cyclotransferase [Deltaproteobacteria bacterium Smac51]|nr:glutaminyl-peptide cyclotransferase [Deltaproteobacteria bacterium Smac51]